MASCKMFIKEPKKTIPNNYLTNYALSLKCISKNNAFSKLLLIKYVYCQLLIKEMLLSEKIYIIN